MTTIAPGTGSARAALAWPRRQRRDRPGSGPRRGRGVDHTGERRFDLGPSTADCPRWRVFEPGRELCTPPDVLSRDLSVSRQQVGDLLVFARAGGYGWDMQWVSRDKLRHRRRAACPVGHAPAYRP